MFRPSIFWTAVAAGSLAAQNTFPLPASAGVTTATETTAPFVLPLRMTQSLVTNRSTLRAQGLHDSLARWDMVTFDPSSRWLFVPCEASAGGGVFRYDTQTGTAVTLWRGNGAGANNRNPDPASFNPATDDTVANDPCSWTPWNTILFGEEATGGRCFECTNPLAPVGPFQIVWRSRIPAVSHEGMRFDAAGNLYFIDEDNSGCIYRFVPTVPGNLGNGQTFVLSVDGYASDPDANPSQAWNSTGNRLTNRFGTAHWVPMTNANGVALTATDPFVYVTVSSGRLAADELLGTPYGRPEDLDIGRLANGHQCLYVALTSEHRVMSIELVSSTTAIAREFVNFDTINLATGLDVNPLQNDPYTSPGAGTVFNAPDNIAIDAFGAVYVCEDASPGDIWKCVDADRDGVGEALGLFVTLGVSGAEPTGITFDPNDPYRFVCSIQHPASSNDALWSFKTRPYAGSNGDLDLLTGVAAAATTGPGEFVKTARAPEVVTIAVRSRGNALGGRPFTVLLQPFATGVDPVPFVPTLWLSPFGQILPLVGGPVGAFTAVLPSGGSITAVRVPPFLAGVSVMVQAIAIASNGSFVCTDGHEIVLR